MRTGVPARCGEHARRAMQVELTVRAGISVADDFTTLRGKEKEVKLEQIMSKDVMCCSYNHRLADAARLMWERDVGCVPVVDEAGLLIGMITDRDICMGAYTQGKRLEDIPIKDVMARDVHALTPEDTVERAQTLMRDKRVRRIPVIDGQRRVVGIVSLNDLALDAVSKRPHLTTLDLARTLGAVGQRRPAVHVAA